MKTFHGKLLLTALLLALTMMGCGFGGEVENNGDPVATSVAATMEALGLGVEGSGQSEPIPVVAYADGGDVWIGGQEGEKRLIFSGDDDRVSGIRFSPDGDLLVFTSRDQYGVLETLWGINPDGTNLRALIDRAKLLTLYDDPNVFAVQISYLEFIPGKNALAFSTWPVRQNAGYAPQGDLRTLDLDSGALTTITPATNSNIQYYYSPDGSRIAFIGDGSAGLMDSNGGERREDLITYTPVAGESFYIIDPVLRWAEDSSRFLVGIPLQESPEGETGIGVWEVPAIGDTAKEIVTIPAKTTYGSFENPISPDLRYLVYFNQNDETTSELHILDLDQGEDMILYAGPGVLLESWEPWSPDSSAFLFSINNQFQLARLGSGYSAVPVSGNAEDATWVDESSYLVYTGEEPNFQLDYIKIGSPPVTIATLGERFLSYDAHK